MCCHFWYSTQHNTTYVKKLAEDNNTMDEIIQFLAVRIVPLSSYIHEFIQVEVCIIMDVHVVPQSCAQYFT